MDDIHQPSKLEISKMEESVKEVVDMDKYIHEQPYQIEARQSCNEEINDKTKHEKLEDDEDKEEGLLELERIVAFTDAVVAIAMTLLILPLMEGSGTGEPLDVGTIPEWYSEKSAGIQAFLISFLCVVMFWRSHFELCAVCSHMTKRLSKLNALWMMAITFLPVSTSLLHHFNSSLREEGGDTFLEGEEESIVLQSTTFQTSGDTSMVYVQYIGNLLVVRFLGLIMVVEAAYHPTIWKRKCGPKRRLFVDGVVDVLLFGIAMGLSFTPVGVYGLLLLFGGPLITRALVMLVPRFQGRVGDRQERK